MSVTDWLLEGDPAVRWQVLRDLTNASADDVAAERARVEHDGWGARLLALEDPDGLWDGGACFPPSYTGGEPGQPWTATMHTLQTLLVKFQLPRSGHFSAAVDTGETVGTGVVPADSLTGRGQTATRGRSAGKFACH